MPSTTLIRENHIVIHGWMLTDLHLKGNELVIYACIYGFSQFGENKFDGTLKYLADWCESTKQGVMKALDRLIEKGYITKTSVMRNGVKHNSYKAVDVVKGGKQSLTVVNKVEHPGQQSLINDSLLNKLKNKINIIAPVRPQCLTYEFDVFERALAYGCTMIGTERYANILTSADTWIKFVDELDYYKVSRIINKLHDARIDQDAIRYCLAVIAGEFLSNKIYI